MSAKPKFLTVEGTEGVGKTSCITTIQASLERAGIKYVVTREPGGTPFAEEIRSLLLQPRDEPVSEMSELLLMFAARAQHIDRVIKPALESGRWVVCDRFTDATYAYQGGGRGVDEEKIGALEKLVQGELRPDVTILLDAPVEIGMARARGRGEFDRFEREKLDFFEKIRACYLARSKRFSDQYRVVDASASLDEVSRAIQAHIELLAAG